MQWSGAVSVCYRVLNNIIICTLLTIIIKRRLRKDYILTSLFIVQGYNITRITNNSRLVNYVVFLYLTGDESKGAIEKRRS